MHSPLLMIRQRGETDFFSGEPLRALSTLVFSDNVDLQRSASLTFAEITERGTFLQSYMCLTDFLCELLPFWSNL